MITIPYPISYHGGHSKELCDHASDNKESIIKSYLKKGFKYVGITEHLPPPNDNLLYKDEIELGHDAKFLNDRFEEYFKKEIPRLKKELNLNSNYLFGFETEFYGDFPEKNIEDSILKYSPEIMVASVHHVNDIPIDESPHNYDKAVQSTGNLEGLYLDYFKSQFNLIKCLQKYSKNIPIVLGHMDVIRKLSPDFQLTEKIISSIKKNIEEAVKGEFAFEINLRALAKGLSEPYPQKDILDLIKTANGHITLGDDSHSAEQVGLNYSALTNFYNGPVSIVEKQGDSYTWTTFVK